MNAPVAEVRDGTLWVEAVAKDGALHAVSMPPPFDFETIELACAILHETLAGVPACEIVMVAVAASGILTEGGDAEQAPGEGLSSPVAESETPNNPISRTPKGGEA